MQRLPPSSGWPDGHHLSVTAVTATAVGSVSGQGIRLLPQLPWPLLNGRLPATACISVPVTGALAAADNVAAVRWGGNEGGRLRLQLP